jgi:hypothetical protein
MGHETREGLAFEQVFTRATREFSTPQISTAPSSRPLPSTVENVIAPETANQSMLRPKAIRFVLLCRPQPNQEV